MSDSKQRSQRLAQWSGWLVLGIVASNLLIDTIEVSSFFVSLPTIMTHFDASIAELLLMSSAFPVGFAVGIPLAQPIAARVGARRLLVVALFAFANFAVAGAISTVTMIVIARLVKGLAAGLTTPLGNSVIGAAFDSDSERDRAGRIYSFIGGVGFIGGMAVTAPLVAVSWRFGISWTAPVAALLALSSAAFLPRNVAVGKPASSTFKLPLTLIVVIAIGSIVVVPAPPSLRLLAGVISGVGIIAVVGIGSRGAIKAGAARTFVANGITAGLFNAFFTSFFATAFLLLHGSGWSAVMSSVVLTPVALGMALATPLTGHISRSVSDATAIFSAVVLCAVAYVWFGLSESGDGMVIGSIAAMAALIGLAFVLGFVALNMRALSFASPENRGVALSWYQVLVQSGAALSIPVVSVASELVGRDAVSGWPMVLAIGCVGFVAIAYYSAVSGRSKASSQSESFS